MDKRVSITSILVLLCAIGCVSSQYSEEIKNLPNKQNPTRRIKSRNNGQSQAQVTSYSTPRFRKPVPIDKAVRFNPEAISDLPVFASGIRGSKPFSTIASIISLEQNDDASVQAAAQSNYQIQQPNQLDDIKPVSEEHEDREDSLVQLISNVGNVANFGLSSGNLLPVTSSPISTPGPTSYPATSYQQIQYRTPQYQPIIQSSSARPPQQPTPTQPSTHYLKPVTIKPARAFQKPSLSTPAERNEFEDTNEGRQIAKQRANLTPKKAKQDYYPNASRSKKPVAQVVRRYREETADGSIVWGFENDDGSFKEEIIGKDCITRGKYGYVDPDGLRREYTYETGIKCNQEPSSQQDQDILNTFVDYQENKLVLPSGKTIDLSSMGKKQARRPQLNRN